MKLKLSTILAVAVIACGSFLAFTPKADTYTVDLTKSSISWEAKKLVGGHTGFIDLTSGSLIFSGKKLAGGGFVANMSSIKTMDNEKPNAGLDKHLKADDFFGVEKFPTSSFTIKKIQGNGANVNVTGDLTIKGKTNSITFPATITWNADKTVTAVADKIEIDRTKYGIEYRSKSVFSDIGNKMIEDIFTISVKLVVKK
ncbi:YceI family protein [Pedobacter insulae]|uniref:Polyisoprenoid-binding protein YceI n=1 Tax=Pedobacter insulae TaxID=414048 RepID=A0A1I2ZV09_9SPHI|nr:YceI family protein [Pedobacter insulae]SFH41446.1 Polyisoprenoid-binding protein YceI [Pedobacter insulae]